MAKMESHIAPHLLLFQWQEKGNRWGKQVSKEKKAEGNRKDEGGEGEWSVQVVNGL